MYSKLHVRLVVTAFNNADATALSNSYFGDGDDPYHLSGLNCRGDERTLLNCPYFGTIGYHTRSPGNDAGVRCDGNNIVIVK